MLEVEQLFSSYGRARVLRVLFEGKELNVSEITRRTGLSHSSVGLHLDFLAREGLVREKRFNRIRILSVNHDDPRASVLLRFLADWRSVTSDQSLRPRIAFN
jgi:DNA-binding transcriptional ArsR family regulator